MKPILTSLALLFGFCTISQAQNQQVYGVVLNQSNYYPVKNVLVCISGAKHCLHTNKEGRFTAFIDAEIKIDSITFSAENFADTTLYFPDEIPEPLKVELQFIPTEERQEYPFITKRRGGVLGAGVDFAAFDFSDFSYAFDEIVIDSINGVNSSLTFSLDFIFNRIQVGFRFGLSGSSPTLETDSLQVEIGLVFYDLHCAYNLIRTEHVTFGPLVGLKWYRHRLRIYSNQESLDLLDYTNKGELDLRFHNLTAFLGGHVMMKSYGSNARSTDLILGAYAGALLPLHPDVWVKTRDHKINVNADVQLPSFQFGVYLAIGRDGWRQGDKGLF